LAVRSDALYSSVVNGCCIGCAQSSCAHSTAASSPYQQQQLNAYTETIVLGHVAHGVGRIGCRFAKCWLVSGVFLDIFYCIPTQFTRKVYIMARFFFRGGLKRPTRPWTVSLSCVYVWPTIQLSPIGLCIMHDVCGSDLPENISVRVCLLVK
jgi:hypothetical protein